MTAQFSPPALKTSLFLVQDTFQLQTFSLDNIAQITGLNFGMISLSNFPLIQRQTIASFINRL
jgi:hypothetical protein